MRKTLLLPLFSLASCAFAQKSFFGVDAGINVANQREQISGNLSGSPAPSPPTITLNLFFQNTIKPTFGFFYQKGFSEVLALRMQAQYMSMGHNRTYASGDDLEINYLTFPLSLRYAANKHLNFGAGPYLSFTLNGSKVNNQDITKTYHQNDFGFSLGAEHDIYKNISLSVNYFIGTKNIILQDEVKDEYGNDTSYKYTNRALQFALIYKFKKTN